MLYFLFSFSSSLPLLLLPFLPYQIILFLTLLFLRSLLTFPFLFSGFSLYYTYFTCILLVYALVLRNMWMDIDRYKKKHVNENGYEA